MSIPLTFSLRRAILFAMENYTVPKLPAKNIEVEVPASKSLLNRALILAAFTEGDVFLRSGEFGTDTHDMLRCLSALGIRCEVRPDVILVHDCKKMAEKAKLNVGSAGTVARFLTAVLAFRGGEYEFSASEQMSGRPLDFLAHFVPLGVRFEYGNAPLHFPFRMRSPGITASSIETETNVSTQFASGILLAAAVGNAPFTLTLRGQRTQSDYIRMTQETIRRFGGNCEERGNAVEVTPVEKAPAFFEVEPDLSGACYFYALSLLLRVKVLVKGVTRQSVQGDIRFLDLLAERGAILTQTEEGLAADGTFVRSFKGFDVKMTDFSDQTLTVAALAPFADTDSILRGVAHIRRQECDRIEAAVSNLNALGVPASATEDSIMISPAPIRGGTVKTFRDHRVAMAFSLIGAKCGNVSLDDASCVSKTFGSYFKILEKLASK